MRRIAQLSHIQGVLRQRAVNQHSAPLCLWVPQHLFLQAGPQRSLDPMALTGQSCPSPSSLSPCPRCASLALSPSGINPCSPSPAPNQSLLLLDARCVSPGVARLRIAFHAACRGCSAAVTAFPLNYLGLALLPAPRLPGGSVTAAKSNPWCRCGMLALPAHLRTGPRAAGGPAWGLSHLAKQFTGGAQVA